MPRIMIFDGAPQAAQKRITGNGGSLNEALFIQAVGMFAPAETPLEFLTVNVADGERLPQGYALRDFDGVCISGSPLNVYKDEPAVRGQIAFAREIFHAGIPTFGCCWGLQLMTAALGGKVRLNPNGREIGVARTIVLNEAGREHAMYRAKGEAFDALCSHEDEVEALPACGRLLASNAVSRVQAAEMAEGDKCFWGVQYHPEHLFSQTAAIIRLRPARYVSEGLTRSEAEALAVADDFLAVEQNPARTDLAWRYGLGGHVLDPALRRLEFRNWLESKVLPYARSRA
jgi:GMP synthase (glutamine-hydrolysing)